MNDFVTKDSGARAEFDSGMVRDTQEGKPRFDLLIPEGVPFAEQFMTRCADLMARGAVKYEDRNWEQANSEEELARFRSSAIRHLNQWVCGDTDEDHAAAVVFNLLAFETTRWKLEQTPVSVQPSDTDIRIWIHSNPQEFNAWLLKQARIRGNRVMTAGDARRAYGY